MTVPNPAADVRQMIEVVKARHVKREDSGGSYCRSCIRESWPCDAIQLATRLEQAVTALEFYAQPDDGDDPTIGTIARQALERAAAAMEAGE